MGMEDLEQEKVRSERGILAPESSPGGESAEAILYRENESLRLALMRQTEALAAAAHELKTPLSIMQGVP